MEGAASEAPSLLQPHVSLYFSVVELTYAGFPFVDVELIGLYG
jgi:hypothetical protein